MISQLPTPWSDKKKQKKKFNQYLRDRAADMLKTQRYEVSNYVYQRHKKNLCFGSDLKKKDRKINLNKVSQEICDIVDDKKIELEEHEHESDKWLGEVLEKQQIKALDGYIDLAQKHQETLEYMQLPDQWIKASKAKSMVNGPGFEKLKNLYSSHGQGNDDFDRPQENVLLSKKYQNIKGRTQANRPSVELTAFGFPTIHPNYPHRDENKYFVKM